jgi:hypothetical protein
MKLRHFGSACSVLTIIILSLAACGGGSSDSMKQSGTLSLGITDAPLDSIKSVVIQFSGIAFKRTDSAPETITALNPSPQSIDLMQYRDGRVAMLLPNVSLPAGDYEWVRLIVDNAPNVRDSFVVLDGGAECELRVPSGAESGLKLNRGFTMPAEGNVALTVEFDLRKSIHAPPGQSGSGLNCTQGYMMRPTLRMVNNANVGVIAGHVDAALVTSTCHPAVYVFAGSNVTPDDIEETSATTPDVDPFTTTSVSIVPGAMSYAYQIAFVPPGEYTMAFTCSSDDPAADEVLTFLPAKNVVVQTNVVSVADFTAPPPAPAP